MIPGDRGKVGTGWLVRPPQESDPGRGMGAQFTSSSDSVRALSVTRKRNLAARSDEKPFQAESSSADRFRVCVNRSDPEGQWSLLRTSTVRDVLTGSPMKTRPLKNGESRTKRTFAPGKTRGHGKACETFPETQRCHKRHR
jgi:hypothetical protein